MSVAGEYVHHLVVQFPIVLAFVLAAVGVYGMVQADVDAVPPLLDPILRWGGWTHFATSTIAVVSGLVAAPGTFGGTDTVGLRHHRGLALTVWVAVAFATYCYERGARGAHPDWKRLSVLLWCVVAFGLVGVAHWGGSQLHPDAVPEWLETKGAEEDPEGRSP